MKNSCLLIGLLVSALFLHAQNPLPNPSFEAWSGGKPVGWENSSGLSPYTGVALPIQVPTGNFAPEMTYAGTLSLGNGSGFSTTTRWKYFNFYYHYYGGFSHYVAVHVYFKNGNDTIGEAFSNLNATNSSAKFRALSLPVVYTQAGNPTSCTIDIVFDDHGTGGTVMVDDVALSNTPLLSPESPLRFLALGDSYTIGEGVAANQAWPAQLADSLAVRGIATDTLNIIATTGWRTDDLQNGVKNKKLLNGNYNLVSLLIGVNNQFQNRPFSQYVTEFKALLDSAIRYAGGIKSHVFVVSIPDYAYTLKGQQSANPSLISSDIDQYNAFSKHLADSMQISYFDITPISRQGLQNTAYVGADSLHPSSTQYTEWVKLMLNLLDEQAIEVTGINPVNAVSSPGFTLSPNPVTDYLGIEISDEAGYKNSVLGIYNVTGTLLWQQPVQAGAAKLAVGWLPKGTYLVKISSGNRQTTRKFVKAG